VKKAILLLIFGLAFCSLYAQLLPSQRYTSKDGLIADRITAIEQDERGVMWFGSFFGLGSYDGISFQKIRLPFQQQNKFVTSVLAHGKKVYAGFLFGGGLVELEGGRVNSHLLHSIDSTIGGDVTALGKYDDQSILLANSTNDIFQFSQGKFKLLYSLKQEFSSSGIHGIFRDNNNNVWANGTGGLVIIRPNNKSQPLHFFKGREVISVVPLEDGRVWIATSDGVHGSVFLCKGLKGDDLDSLSLITSINGLRFPGFKGNSKNGFWALHWQKGLINISENGTVNYFSSAVNTNADLTALYADREHNLWIANDPGLIKISNFSSSSWYFKNPAAGGGYILKARDGVTWVNNSKELYAIKNDTITRIEFRGNESGYMNKMVQDAEDNIWIVRWEEGVWKTRWQKDKLISSKYFSAFGDHKLAGGAFRLDSFQNIWLGGMNGVFRIKNGEVKERFAPAPSSGVPFFVNCIVVDYKNKALWLGDNAQGLVKVRFRVRDGNPYGYVVEKIIGPADGLKDPYIRSMFRDHKGDVWVGTRAGGVYKLAISQNREIPEEISPPGGFACSRITAIAEENKEAIWIATCDGIYRFHQQSNQWTHYDVSDGILSAEVFHLLVDSLSKQVWVMTEQGITRINQSIESSQSVPPLVHITQVNVLGKPDSLALYHEGIRRYQYANNSIGFVFAASSFLNEKKNVYKYMLQGYDQEWSKPVTTHAVNYASLAPGRYTFKVLAANANGEWSPSPASFSFHIILPFYRRPWFVFACLAILASLFYLVRMDRLQQKYKVEKIRMRIARDLHDDIGSALGSINLMSETAHRRLERSKSAVEVAGMFTRIGNSAQNTLESMDDIIWSINPEKDKLGDLVIRMREFAIPLLEAKGIEFDFKVNAVDYKKLPMNLRKNIFLIFKESIFNIVKHADCTRVLIATEIRDNKFHLLVKDNGKGFDLDQRSERNGLRNMKKRSEMLGGTLRIDSAKEKGTSLDFRCSIK
jgi:signal transduction histidine kinase